jgi:hypothetical protein
MGIGLLRIYCPQHVWAEMLRKIERKAEKEHLDRDLMERLWWTEYVPFIRCVTCPVALAGRWLAQQPPKNRPRNSAPHQSHVGECVS